VACEVVCFENFVMARKGPKVLLGFEDECITEKHKSLVNFTTNKIGGKPVSINYFGLKIANGSKCHSYRNDKVFLQRSSKQRDSVDACFLNKHYRKVL
jgi:hypothetical protein